MRKKSSWSLGLLALLGLFAYRWLHPSAEQVLADFYAGKGASAEDTIADLLIVHADRVAPLVIKDITNKDMKYRRYAIGFLGMEERTEAIPTLRGLLTDEAESDLIRGDALVAIYQMDPVAGRVLASNYVDSVEFLGSRSQSILEGTIRLLDKPYWDAFWRLHN